MKKYNTYKGHYPAWAQSEFDHRFACWANNHNGWAKMKAATKRLAKHREKRTAKQRMEVEENESWSIP